MKLIWDMARLDDEVLIDRNNMEDPARKAILSLSVKTCRNLTIDCSKSVVALKWLRGPQVKILPSACALPLKRAGNPFLFYFVLRFVVKMTGKCRSKSCNSQYLCQNIMSRLVKS